MKKLLCMLLLLCLLLPAAVLGEEAASAEVKDNLVVTQGSVVIDGKETAYTATTGTMALETPLGQYEIFFTAYTANGVEDLTKRPLTFAFNGGPGSASLWLQMGLLGPQRIDLDENGMIEKIPVGYKPNDCSILDLTDLVFIDPVGTGFSRALPGTDEKTFYDYYNDAQSVGDFITLYVSRNGRWGSPKYVAGESYGTTRAVGVCDYLRNMIHMDLNGLMLVSSANDFNVLESSPGNEMPYVAFLPTFAAAAWYHKKAAAQYLEMTLEDYMEEVRGFASGEYLSMLYQGTRASAEATEATAEKLAAYIGVDKDYVLQNSLRIEMSDFCAKLLSDQKLMIGRIDSRYTGPVVAGSIADGASDPSSTGIMEAFNGAYLSYVNDMLDYHTDRHYNTLSGEINGAWNYDTYNTVVAQENTIHDNMSANKFLKVWVLCGYYDLATPFYGAEWIFSHLFLNEEEAKNLSITYYEAGHMFYLHDPSRNKFREDAKAWFAQ